ncbi:DUF4837 family protein [Maribacter polysiphoniae]|uniref:DUF4837 family protein n=1 Tax=Maribacter polysiphoniae TaxID=429344 RepID=A0A316E5Z0_9FLAO|nr:DUF4837 family protein [Maribacter polysiphoniae]MBD1260027.1 DUF4837 family protein [Maribacter polysiphoniae]PWK25486.1 uncharacterized protein DUF4837 [Maribacter polysiphoniae]
MKHFKLLFALFFVMIISCKESGTKNYLPSSIGAYNSLIVVIDNQTWKSKVGDKVREYFAASSLGLTMDEPIFSITQIPPEVFSGSVRNSRNVLYVQKDTLNLAHVKSNMYSQPQKVAVIKGTTDDEIIENIEEKAPEFIRTFKELELKEAQQRFLKSLNKEKDLQDKFGVNLNIPSVYKVVKSEDNFVWYERQIQKGTMNIIAYTMPWNSFSVDSTFVKDIVRMRDSIGSLYIPGPDVPGKRTHMRTEPAFSPSVFPSEIAGNKAAEVRGLWDIKNYPMAGPFITYIVNDKEHNRKMVVEGFTFAPSTEKRDSMFELEAIMKTLRFKE